MSNIQKLGAELANVMRHLQQICDAYGFDATPTVVLRHNVRGAKSSIVIGNDDPAKVTACIHEVMSDESAKLIEVVIPVGKASKPARKQVAPPPSSN